MKQNLMPCMPLLHIFATSFLLHVRIDTKRNVKNLKLKNKCNMKESAKVISVLMLLFVALLFPQDLLA